jgi:uncharacterized membrane protein YcaP (DUF421 family)
MQTLDWIFGHTQHVNAWQACARAVLIFAYGLLLTRLVGRRLFGKWSALDIVVSIIVGSNLSRALTGSAPLFATLVATTLLFALHWILARLAAQSQKASRLLEGLPIVIARDGELEVERLHQNAISDADVNEALRQSGVRDVANTEVLTLEPSGKITVIKR